MIRKTFEIIGNIVAIPLSILALVFFMAFLLGFFVKVAKWVIEI